MITVIGDQLTGRIENGEMIREVEGNVILTQDNIVITCDKAIHYISRNDAHLIGNVVVTQDTLTIETPEGFYFGNQRRAFSDKTVKLNDRKVILTAQKGEYFFNENLAFFETNVKLFDKVSTLTSDILYYYRNEEKAICIGNVKITDAENKITADSLIHWRSSRITHAFNNVKVSNVLNNVVMYGHKLIDLREDGLTTMEIDPLLIQIDTTFSNSRKDSIISIDTLLISALLLKSIRDTSEIFYAEDSVKIIRGNFSSANDYSVFFRNEDYLYTKKISSNSNPPVIWVDNAQLYGDSIFIKLDSNKIKRIDMVKNAVIASSNENYPMRYDQVAGGRIVLNFSNNKMNSTEVYDNVLSIYYLYEDEEPSGLIKASALEAVIIFNEDLVDEVRFYGLPNSEYHPENLIIGKEKFFFLPQFVVYNYKPEKNQLLKSR